VKLIPFFSLVLGSLISANASAEYCAAIRGNGELMPAHWGAMSSIVEDEGMPSAMAGGSSASITMFLLESLSLNPLPQNNTERALLIKSFQGYLEALSQTPEGKAIQALLADKGAFQSILALGPQLTEALKKPENAALLQKHLGSLQTLLQSKDLKDIVNPEFALYVQRTVVLSQQKDSSMAALTQYRSSQIMHAIKNFGKFDADTDKTLFVRPGLLNFSKLSQILGQMGDFYAGYNMDSAAGKQIQKMMRDFLNLCAPKSKNLSWRELNQQEPSCRNALGAAVLTYRNSATSTKSRANESVGAHIPAFATTSVLSGSAVNQFTKLYVDYQTTVDPNFGDFTTDNANLRFGYWGDSAALSKIENKFNTDSEYKNDPKSQKFLSLGQTAWSQVLATSPAEPGLSRIVALSKTQLSAGGWSDLHPVMILKAFGCDNIIYVTRKGEESKFARGVFRRLVNANESVMSDFYSMTNPQSSIMRSQKNAAQIKCTDWNSFDVLKDINGLIEESMRAPMVKPPYCK